MPSQRRTTSSQASTQGSIQGEEEQRFAELLKPIKDLTANWNVPLATYLDDYFEEITELQIDIDGQTAKVNFAEAALLLQGTAAVYSRKVEFLWLTVEKMLDLLASKKVLDDGNGNATGIGSRKAKKGFTLDPSNFSCIDLSSELAKNVDMKPEIISFSLPKYGSNATNTPEHHQRKMTLKFIFVTPRQLIERGTEGKEMKEIRVNLYVPPSSNSASSTKYDLIGHKEDFRVNMQFALGTAMIGEELSHQSDLGQQSVSLCEDDSILDDSMSVSLFEPNPSSGNTSQHKSSSNENQGSAPTTASTSSSQKENIFSEIPTTAPSVESQSDSNEQDFDTGGHDEGLSDAYNEDDNLLSEQPSDSDDANKENSGNKIDKVQTRKKTNNTLKDPPPKEQMAPLADPWKPLTPHEAAVTIPKPIRRGRTRRAPTRNVQLAGTKSRPKKSSQNVDNQPIVPVEDFMIQQLSGGKYSLNGLRVGNKDTCMAAELQDRADNVEKIRKRKALLENKQNNNFLEAVEDEQIAEPEENQETPDDVDDNWADIDFEHDPLPDPHEGGIAALVPNDFVQQEHLGSNTSKNENEISNEVDSYEELVMKRVAAYVAQSQDYIESTDLAKRVAKWHDSIGPRLDAVEKRGNFDIHLYGSKILNYFPDGLAKTTIKFTDIARGKEREEVSRYFLSSLMLANTYNIEIGNSTSDPLAMDQVEMTLLSTKRHHESMFQDTSVGENSSKDTTSPKRKGRHRKSINSNATYTSDDDEQMPSTSYSRSTNRKNKQQNNKRTALVNGSLQSIAEEQFDTNENSPVISHHLNEPRTNLDTPSDGVEQSGNSRLSSAQASPETHATMPRIAEFLSSGTRDSHVNNTFKIPVSSIDEYKPGRKRKK